MDKKYVFFLDIDGTLLNNGIVCMKNRTAISRARKAGHLVFINTARSYCIIPDKIINMSVDGYITSLGCNIIINGETIYLATIPTEEAASLYDYFCRKKREIHIQGEDIVVRNKGKDGDDRFANNGKTVLQMCREKHIAKFYIPGILSDEDQKFLNERYTFYQLETYGEFAVKGNTKATGINRVMEFLNIPMEYSVAMGDSMNDIEMLKNAGIAVAMGDGDDAVKEIADIVTCNAKDGGVAEAIYRITGIEKPV